MALRAGALRGGAFRAGALRAAAPFFFAAPRLVFFFAPDPVFFRPLALPAAAARVPPDLAADVRFCPLLDALFFAMAFVFFSAWPGAGPQARRDWPNR